MNVTVEQVAAALLIGSIISILIAYLVIRTAVSHGVDKHRQLSHARAQTELLVQIAHRSGVEAETLNTISGEDRVKMADSIARSRLNAGERASFAIVHEASAEPEQIRWRVMSEQDLRAFPPATGTMLPPTWWQRLVARVRGVQL